MKSSLKKYVGPLLLTLPLAMFLGCSKEAGDKAVKPATPAKAEAPKAEAPKAATPKADMSIPLASYSNVGEADIMYTYYAFSGTPVDYEKMAGSVSTEYQRTTDAFKKKDLAQALKPRFDSEIEKARGKRYLRYELKYRGDMKAYDFQSKSFLVEALNNEGFYLYTAEPGLDDFRIAVKNTKAFSKAPVPDEAKAREIEAFRTKLATTVRKEDDRFDLVLYLFVTGTGAGDQRVHADITHVEIRDGKGKVLLAY